MGRLALGDGLRGAGGIGGAQRQRVAIGQLETERRQAFRKMIGKIGGAIDHLAARRLDAETAGVKVELAADPAG